MSAHDMTHNEVLCDLCGKLLLRGLLPGGGYREIVRPVALYAVDPCAPKGMDTRVDFCSIDCAHRFCLTEDPDDSVKAAVGFELASLYGARLEREERVTFKRWIIDRMGEP